METKKVALFGGSFDPPTIAHQMIAMVAYAETDLDHISVAPSFSHRLKENSLGFDDRMRLCQIAFEPLGFRVTDVEKHNEEGALIDTLDHLKATWPEYEYHVIIGMDCAEEIVDGKWHKGEELVEKYPFVVLGRFGSEALRCELFFNEFNHHQFIDFDYKCNSTEVREAIKQGNFEIPRRRLPLKVWEDIRQKGLYR